MKLQTFLLKDIDINSMQIVKETFEWYGTQDHSRWIFKENTKSGNRKNNKYFKIWNPNYIRRDNILKAIESGFYDDITTPALCGIILHNGLCRGYVMHECKSDWRLQLDDVFFKKIKERSLSTGYFHIQFSPCHVMKYYGKLSLIDLEGVFSICELPKTKEMHCFFDLKEYEEFIVSLYKLYIQKTGGKYSYFLDHSRPRFRKIHPFLRFNQSLILKTMDIFKKKRGEHIHQIIR